MGMFDNLTCHYPLPDGRDQQEGWQTKDLECGLNEYTITESGRLVMTWNGFHELAEAKDTNHHGDITFYDFDENDAWMEYRARFNNGQLEWIKRVN